MRYASSSEVLSVIHEHPGLFLVDYAALIYPDHVDKGHFGTLKHDLANRIQTLRKKGLVRPTEDTEADRIHRWEVVDCHEVRVLIEAEDRPVLQQLLPR